MSTSGDPWSMELEPEIDDRLAGLQKKHRGQALRNIALLAYYGVSLKAPYTRSLGEKLWELRFYVDRNRQRITYYVTTGRRIILLTVFRKTKQREQGRVERARKGMERCIGEGHTPADHRGLQEAEDDGD